MKEDYGKGHSLIQFFLKRFVIILVVALLCLLTFLLANAMTNCAIICDEGLQARVDYALGGATADESDLEDFFTLRYIQTGALQDLHLQYNDFNIEKFVYTSSIDSVSVWPGSTSATLRITESVSRISGQYIGSSTETITLPAWVDGTYEVRMVYQDGRWLIDNMQLLQLTPAATPSATPEGTPLPVQSPTAIPQISPNA